MDLNFLQQLGLISPQANAASTPWYGEAAPAPQPTGNLSPEWFTQATAAPEASPIPEAPPQQMPQDLMAGRDMGSPAPDANALQQLAKPPRERRSILDTIGRISDVLAKVGGADALYQPSLDARQDRGFAIEDRSRQIDMDKLKLTQTGQQIEAGRGEIGDAQAARIGRAALGVKAILAQNPNADVAKIWTLMAKRAGVPDAEAMEAGQAIAADRSVLDGLTGMTAGNLGKQVYYGRDAQGNTIAYQVGPDGQPHPLGFPEGVSPVQGGFKGVDLGGEYATLDPTTGKPLGAPIRKSEVPGGAENRKSREDIERARQAAIAARGTGGKAKGQTQAQLAERAVPILASLGSAIERLHDSGGMTDEKSGFWGTSDAIARETVPGYERLTNQESFSARQDLERLLTQSLSILLPLMTGVELGGKQLDAVAELNTYRAAILSAKDYPSALRAKQAYDDRVKEIIEKGKFPDAPTSDRPASGGAVKRARNPSTGQNYELRNGAWVEVP